ncbi:MAG: NUDIX domain-containing protein [bacterium]|nr:MAG: NUDIX domain-containing protein [bacterium]
MKLIKHIEDAPLLKSKSVKKRFAVRAVLLDKNGLTPVVFASKMNYHKIPGGGIEKGESKTEALVREVYEESGCMAKIEKELGKITEYRSKFEWFQLQTSYCYIGKVIKKGKPHFDKGEVSEGFEMSWFTLDEAIKILKNDKPKDYEGWFIQQRDLAFLEEARKLIDLQ